MMICLCWHSFQKGNVDLFILWHIVTQLEACRRTQEKVQKSLPKRLAIGQNLYEVLSEIVSKCPNVFQSCFSLAC